MDTILKIIFVLMQSFSIFRAWPTDLGCYEVTHPSNIFTQDIQDSNVWDPTTTTIEKCLAACRTRLVRYAALWKGRECYCGDDFPTTATSIGCNTTCSGDSSQICGGKTAVNIYTVCGNGTYKGEFDNDCSRQCNCLAEDMPCHQATGKCESGKCKENFIGEDCNGCVIGMYSSDCSLDCGHCNDTVCRRSDGRCSTEGCKDGYYGDKCDMNCGHCSDRTCQRSDGICPIGCQDGYFGDKCDLKCGHCLDATCQRSDGVCLNGCQVGYYGTTSLGTVCDRKCGQCQDTVCDINNGTCPNGCKEGFYGINCDLKCGYCIDTICNMTDGMCPNGCDPGWQGNLCNDVCKDGTFGQTCSETCGQCKESCNPINGTCSGGCKDDWTGDLCKTKCNDSNSQFGSEDCPCGICPPSTTEEPTKGGLTNMTIIAIGIGGGLFVIIFVCIMICVCKGCRNSSVSKNTDGEKGRDQGQANQGFDLNMVVPLMVQTKPRNSTGPGSTPGVEDDPNGLDGENRHYVNRYLTNEISLADLGQHLETNVENGGFEKEFNTLPHGLKAESTGDQAKDRFRNIKPYNHNIVKLSMVKKDPNSTFINASYIHGYSTLKKFIATQGPKKNTTGDFWRMILEQKVTKIVMVTNLKEFLVEKCEAYWPNSKERYLKYGDIRINIQRVEEKEGYTVRTINLMNVKDAKYIREITQLHFTAWPDNGVPDTPTQVNAFLSHVRELCKDETAPIVVHCSAGVGRTGTIIAMDILTDEAEKEGVVDVYKCVNLLRDQRVNMVQTLDQYIFIHRALYDALCKGQ